MNMDEERFFSHINITYINIKFFKVTSHFECHLKYTLKVANREGKYMLVMPHTVCLHHRSLNQEL